MPVPRRMGVPVGALVAVAAAVTPLAFESTAQAAPEHRVDSRSAEAPAPATGEASAKGVGATGKKGIHSRSGVKKCGKGKTVWLWDEAIGRTRVSWKPGGGRLVSRKWAHAPDGISVRTIPTWRKSVKWKVTSIYGVGKKPKKLVKAYAYCSKNGWRVGAKPGKVGQQRSGVKRCPAGKTVMIEDSGIGSLEHKFKSLKRGSKVHTHAFGGSQGYLVTVRWTPTEMRSVKWVVNARNAKNLKGQELEGKGVELYCISKY
ncbi:hypothetical protein [Streptomyces sp. NPDC059009]|uniref:hypothetical protein n=1 Tax=Streptomyces sp. NPDC059009 TaxID=3346694 RepID=UPI003679E8DD